MLECIGFAKQKVVFEDKETTRIVAKFSDLTELKMFIPSDSSIEATVARIKEDKSLALKQVRIRVGEYGKYAYFSHATDEEEL